MKHFTGCLSQDLRRCLLSKQFVLSTIGVSLIHFLSAWWDIQASYSCVAYYYFVARVMGLENLFLVVAVIPGALSFRKETDNAYGRMVIIRSSMTAYLTSKSVVAFISAALVSVLGDFLFIGGLSLYYPIWDASFSNQVAGIDIWKYSAMYFVYYILIRSFCAALFSVVTLLISLYVNNMFVVLSVPIAGFYFWETLSDYLQFPSQMDIRHLLNGTALGWESMESMVFSLSTFVILSLLSSVYFIFGGRRKLASE
jgi:hypothetical protein